MPILRPTIPLISVSKNALNVLGEADLVLDGGLIWTWVIAENITYEAILGADLLKHQEAQLDFSSNTLILAKQKFPLIFNDSLPPETTAISCPLLTLIEEYADIFFTKGQPIRPCKLNPLVINTGSSKPVFQRPYRTPLAKRGIVEKEIDNLLKLGFIRPSSSPYSAPLLIVPKKDSSWRTVLDYRRLNEVTRMDRHPLPLIQDIFDQLGGSTVFTTLDLKQGYHQLPVHPNSIEKTAFSCHCGHFEWTRMPMGVSCGPPVFQREMQKAMAGLVGKCCLVYLDDLVIFSQNQTDHVEHVKTVFKRLRTFGLTLKREKCTFAAPEVDLLGFVISEKGIRAKPDKIQAIAELRSPTTAKEVRSFLGMTGYYRQTMPNYAQLAEPMVALTRKKVPFTWSLPQQQSFDALKAMLLGNQVMAFPMTNEPYLLYTDASDYACGAILVQLDEHGTERVVQYVSHQLSGAQLRWATIEKEAFAVVYALKKLWPYLLGARFVIYTDHKPLKAFFSSPLQNVKLQRWAITISEYGAAIEYKAGSENTRADMLSRIRAPEIAVIDTCQWVDADFPDGLEVHHIPLEADQLTPDRVKAEQLVKFPDLFIEAQEADSEYEIFDGMLYSTRKPSNLDASYPHLLMPPCFRPQIIMRAHHELGHMGSFKTHHRVAEAYVWPGMKAEITRAVQACPRCTVHIKRRERTPMGEMPIACYPGQLISTDLTGPFVESTQGNKYILTILDHFSGWVECYAIPDKRSSTVAKCFTDDYFPRAGFAEKMVSDNGGEFNERELRAYFSFVGVEQVNTTPVHPQSNGKIERFNRTLKDMLRKLCNGARAQWQTQLPDAIMAYRNAVSSVTGYTPFFLYHGRRARIPLSTLLAGAEPPPNLLGNRLATMTEVFQQAQEHTRESRHHNRQRLARKANATDIVVGDTVIVAANEPVTLSAKWDHQFEVTKVRGLTYWVRHQLTNKELKLHRDKLRLVDPNMAWDDVADRPRRQQIRRVPLLQPQEPMEVEHVIVIPPPAPPVAPPMPCAPQATETCTADIHAPPAIHIAQPAHSGRPGHANPQLDTQLLHNRPATRNNGNETIAILPPTCPDTPNDANAMATEPPAYTLRKRNAVGWVINPGDAKKSRIDCLTFTGDWYSRLTPPTPPTELHTPAIPEHDTTTTTPPVPPHSGSTPQTRRTWASLFY